MFRVMGKLPLQEVLQSNRLQEFIAQAERENVGPVGEAEFNETASHVIRTPPQDGQTSGTPRRDGARGN
jgi:hypothetical protein